MMAARTGCAINFSWHAGVRRWPPMSAYEPSKAARLMKLAAEIRAQRRRFERPSRPAPTGLGDTALQGAGLALVSTGR